MIGGDPNGVLFKDFCWQSWLDKYSTSPPWGSKDFAMLHEARSRLDTEELARTAWKAFLEAEDSYLSGHSPRQFLFSLSKFTVAAIKRLPQVVNKAERFPGAARAAAMVRILQEVEADDTIPQTMKRDEMAKRWKGIEV